MPVPGSAAGAELQQALRAWLEHCANGVQALQQGDVDALEQRLDDREALRPRIQVLLGRVLADGVSPALRSQIARLAAEAGDADAHLTRLMEAEQFRLRHEIDALRQETTSEAAYRRSDAPSPHRMNIVR